MKWSKVNEQKDPNRSFYDVDRDLEFHIFLSHAIQNLQA